MASINVPPPLLFEWPNGGKTYYCEPYREAVWFESPEHYERTYPSHLKAAREAFTKCEVFVLTLGLAELWRLRATKHVIARRPREFPTELLEHHLLSVEENVSELQRMLDLWRQHNPSFKLIVSVSPVPLGATFRGPDTHVIEANCYSKAVLRVAVEQFVTANADNGVYYFPSYETVMYCCKNAWRSDQRHVSQDAVDKVMGLFGAMFLTESETALIHARPDDSNLCGANPSDLPAS